MKTNGIASIMGRSCLQYGQIPILISTLALFIATSAVADPVVDHVAGNLSGGQSVVITGTGFSEKSTPEPIVFDKFDDSGTNGQLFQDINDDFWKTYSDNPSNKRPKLSNANPRYSGAGLSAAIYMDRVDYQNDHLYQNNIFTQKVFASFWVRFDPGSPSTHDGQIKLWRICKSSEPNQGPWIYFREHKGPAYTLHRYNADGPDESTSWYGNSLPDYEWTQVTVQMDQGTVGNNDGSLRIWHNGALKISEDNLNFLVDQSRRFESIRFGEYVGNDSPLVATEQFDDIYLDGEWARVEIGNNQNYNSCTHREMQVPTDWSGDNITVTLNRGSFGPTDNAYLFVVDNNGNISEGKPITWSDVVEPDEQPGKPGTPNRE